MQTVHHAFCSFSFPTLLWLPRLIRQHYTPALFSRWAAKLFHVFRWASSQLHLVILNGFNFIFYPISKSKFCITSKLDVVLNFHITCWWPCSWRESCASGMRVWVMARIAKKIIRARDHPVEKLISFKCSWQILLSGSVISVLNLGKATASFVFFWLRP